jgi:hypothetical protein
LYGHQFPALRDWTDPRNTDIDLAAGPGLVTFRDTTGRMVDFTNRC